MTEAQPAGAEPTIADPATADAVKEPTALELEFQKAKGFVEPLARAGKTDEEMLVKLIGEGFMAKKAFKLLSQCLEDLGVRMSAKDRYTQTSDILLGNDFKPTSWGEVRDVCTYLASELEATDEKQAMIAVRRYAKIQKIELPKPVRGEGGPRSGGKSFAARVCKWMVENATAEDATFTEWLKGEKKNQTQINYHIRMFQTGKAMMATVNAPV